MGLSSSHLILVDMVSTTELVWRVVDSVVQYDLFEVKNLVERGEDVDLAVTSVMSAHMYPVGVDDAKFNEHFVAQTYSARLPRQNPLQEVYRRVLLNELPCPEWRVYLVKPM
ncbi:hypothetical protein GQ600_13857 [Phytophthora cactorum]|nr:hypothetical protein GQ600_13857 [Phytophthora cactorum]